MNAQRNPILSPDFFHEFETEPLPGEVYTVKCGKDGVPLLIQRMTYNYSMMSFGVTLFNDKFVRFTSDFACRSIGLTQQRPTPMQWLEAENNVSKYLLDNWVSLFAAQTEY